MDSAQTIYATVALAIVVALVVSAALFLLVRRVKNERVLYGYAPPKSSAYPGYFLLTAGAVIIVVSVVELGVLFAGPTSAAPFSVMNIPLLFGANVLEGDVVGLGLGVAFWLIILWLGGRKLFTLGLDLLRGTKVVVEFSKN